MADVAVGSIRLYDEVTTALPAGRYRFTSRLAVADVDGTAQEPAPDHVLEAEVSAPRFALDAADIVSSHPAPDSTGDVHDRLAHVALSRRTLPWERRFGDGTPWLALLVVATDEGQVTDPRPLRQAVGADLFARLTAADPIDGDGPPVATLLLRDPSVLAGLWPSRRDVRLLAHVRQVNLADSELAGADDDGWFAVVTANRLPVRPGKYRACLVSLEGQEELWTATPGSVPPLVVLHQWAFTAGTTGSFESLAAAVDLGLAGTGSALTRIDRDGFAGPVRYHGPLAEVADGELAADDVSLAAAHEIGRLLAIADARFTREIVAWHRGANLARTRQIFGTAVGGALARSTPATGTGIDDLEAALRQRLTDTAGPPASRRSTTTIGDLAVSAPEGR